jgi:thioredoxin 1
MKKLPRNFIASVVLVCSFVLAVADAHAGGGKARVEAAKSKGVPVFVDFGKTSCTPCKKMVPVLDSLTKKYKGRMEVVFIHIDEEREFALQMGVTVIPTQVLIDKNGKEVSRHIGYMPMEDCEKMIGKTAVAAPGACCK